MSPDQIFIHVNDCRVSLAALLKMKRDDVRTVYASGCTGLTALPDLPNAKTVDASGCTGLTALPDLPNAEYVYASGCTGLTALPDLPNVKLITSGPAEQYFFAGVDSRGYTFEAITVSGQWRVIAGCRNLSLIDAKKHWRKGGPSDRPDCLALVEKIAERVAAIAIGGAP